LTVVVGGQGLECTETHSPQVLSSVWSSCEPIVSGLVAFAGQLGFDPARGRFRFQPYFRRLLLPWERLLIGWSLDDFHRRAVHFFIFTEVRAMACLHPGLGVPMVIRATGRVFQGYQCRLWVC
jgi:hypothetical protein